MNRSDLLKAVFGHKPEAPLMPVVDNALIAPPPPPPKEEIPPEVSAQVQSMVWGAGAPVAPPPPKMADKGQVNAMSPDKGWGKV